MFVVEMVSKASPPSFTEVPLSPLEIERLGDALQHAREAQLRDLCRLDVRKWADPPVQSRVRALRQMLHEIHDAEVRIEAGTYGRCVRCSGPIGLARLEQVPFASACSPCLMDL